jgi:putative FmdB family regulatory protein
MPLYDYKCTACKKTSEYLVANSDSHPLECHCCHKIGNLEREVAHAFNMASGGKRSSLSPADEIRMRGGKKIATKIDIYGSGRISVTGVYEVPNASNN